MLAWIMANKGLCLGLLYNLLSTVVGVVPTKYHGAFMRFMTWLSCLTPPDVEGTFKLPFTSVTIRVTRVPPLPILFLLCALPGCIPVPSGGGTVGVPPWSVAVNVTISAAHGADAAIRGAIGQQSIDENTREHIVQILDEVDNSLDAAATALATYQASQTVPHQCQLHTVLEGVVTGMLQLEAVARDAGAPIPPVVEVVLGSLAAAADAVAPQCVTTTPAASIRVYAAEYRSARASGGAQ